MSATILTIHNVKLYVFLKRLEVVLIHLILMYVHALLQKLGAIYLPKSRWDLKSEITSLHFTDFTLVKVIYYNITI
jgi:hypothetical protein